MSNECCATVDDVCVSAHLSFAILSRPQKELFPGGYVSLGSL